MVAVTTDVVVVVAVVLFVQFVLLKRSVNRVKHLHSPPKASLAFKSVMWVCWRVDFNIPSFQCHAKNCCSHLLQLVGQVLRSDETSDGSCQVVCRQHEA